MLRYNPPEIPPSAIVAGLISTCFADAHTALDLTPGRGNFWNGQVFVSVQKSACDFRSLDYPNEAFDLAVFDPPHQADQGKRALMQHFGSYPHAELKSVIQQGCREAMRVARLGAIVKVTDGIHASTFQHESGWVIEALGTPFDYATGQHRPIIDPKWRSPALSVRSNGSIYLCFRHGDQRHLRRGPKPPPVLL